jgi:3-deoxy-7-phosphoheptulonate synthase
MIVLVNRDISRKELDEIVKRIEGYELRADVSRGKEHTVIGVVGSIDLDKVTLREQLLALEYVQDVKIVSKPYKLASKLFGEGKEVVVQRKVDGKTLKVSFNDKNVITIGGPCAVESYEQVDKTASFLSRLGVRVLRGGAFKPRSAPRSFEGLGEVGLKILNEMREKYSMLIVTELLDLRHAELVAEYADVIQIGTRNMQNFALLKVAGEFNMPVLLKRGLAATIEEWLNAAEYILDGQKEKQVILCERGIRTFETMTRNTFDLNAIAVIRALSWLPLIADPSHATGKSEYVPAVSCGAVAAGADGLLIEVHPDPSKALTDGAQSLEFKGFETLYDELKKIARVKGRVLV